MARVSSAHAPRPPAPAPAPDSPLAHGERTIVARVTGLAVDLGGHPVLRGVDLAVRAGEVLAVVGRNGSGKSTLLAALAGLVEPRAGRVDRATDEVALVLQQTALSERLPLTVGELVAMGRWRRTGPWRPLSRADRSIIAESLETVGLTALGRRSVSELSGGQRQRALLAQGLAQRAPLLLLDEPMTALDAPSRAAIDAAVVAAADSGTAVVVVTHDLAHLSRVDAVIELHPPAS